MHSVEGVLTIRPSVGDVHEMVERLGIDAPKFFLLKSGRLTPSLKASIAFSSEMCAVEFLMLDQHRMYERMDSLVRWVQARSSSIEAGLLLVPLKFRMKLYATSSQLWMEPEDRLLSQIRAAPVSYS